MIKNFVFGLAAMLLLAGCISEKKGNGNRVKVGDRIPSFTVTNSSGNGTTTFSQADFEGRRSMVIFFATWCPDCRRELPIVYEAWLRLRDRPDFRFIAISREESADTVATYWNGATPDTTPSKPSFEGMPWLLDPDASAFNTFADSYIPRVYLVDTRGRVASVAIEKFDMTADGLVKLIEELP